MKTFVHLCLKIILSILCFWLPSLEALSLADFQKRPKLVVVIVIDQFRADYLTRFENQFRKPKSGLAGFNFFLSQGAYFPYADFELAQCMTGPGHATILTGSYPYASGIPINEWWDRANAKRTYCVEDASYPIIGLSDSSFGRSPQFLMGSTVGDELKNADYDSRVVTVAYKDRSAILLGGRRADLALWYEDKVPGWTSSAYYIADKKLPEWVSKKNSEFIKEKCDPAHICMTRQTLDLAIESVQAFKLGSHRNTDLLAIGFSSHDIIGHKFGPNSAEMKKFILEEDEVLFQFLNRLRAVLKDKFDETVFVLTGDHGGAPYPTNPPQLRSWKQFEIKKELEQKLTKQFGAPPRDEFWLPMVYDFNFYLNASLIRKKNLKSKDVESFVKEFLLSQKGVVTVVTRSEIAEGYYPVGLMGSYLRKSYSPERNGDVIVLTEPFVIPVGDPSTHITGYSYDRTVPLVFVGRPFKKGVYPEGAKVVDLAPTLSWIAGIVPPALSEGRVLHEMFLK